MEGGRDPRLDRKEPQLQTDTSSADSSSSDGSGDGTATITGDASADLETFVKSDAYARAAAGAAAPAAAADPAAAPAGGGADDDASADLTLGDVGTIFEGAAAGNATDQAIASLLTDDASIAGAQRQAGLAGISPEVTDKVLADRIAQAEADAAAGAGGDRDAWIRSQQNLAGITPSPEDIANFDKGGGPNILSLEKQFQLLGIETRPQEYLDRIEGLRKDLDAARGGDPDAIARVAGATGADPADLSKELGGPSFDALGSMLSGIASMPAGPAIGIPGGTGTGTGTGNVTSETTSPSGGAASQPASESGSGRLAGGSEDLSGRDPTGSRTFGGSSSDDTPGDGSTPGDTGGGGDDGDPIPDHDDPNAGASGDPTGGGDHTGDASSGASHDLPPEPDAPTDHDGTGAGDGDHASASASAGQSGSASKTEELDFSNEGTTFVAGGGDATQRADGTARVENPDGSVDQVDSHGTNIYHSDTTQYVDNDAGGYSNLTLSSEQAAARLEQKLVRGGGDPVNPDAVESGYVIDIPDQGTMEYRTPDAASTEGTGTITRAPAPKDPVRPEDAQGPLGFTGNPNDPSIYSMGTGGDVAAFQSTSAPGALASPDARATGFGSDSLSPVGHGSGDGDSGGDQAQSSQYAATAASSGDSSPSQTSSTGGFAPAGAGGQIYGLEGAAEGAGGDTGAGAEASGAAGAGSAGGAAGAASAGSGSGAGAAGEAATDASGAAAGAAGAGSAAGAAGPTAGDAAGAASSVASGAASGGAAGGGSAAAAGASTEDGSSGAASSAKAGAAGVVGGGSAAGAAGSTSRASSSPTSGGATSVGTWGATGGGAAADAGATTASDTYALPATGANEAAAGTEGTGSGLAAYDGSASGTTQLGSGDTTVSSAYASTSVPGKEAIFAREAAADTSAKDGPDTYHYAPPTDEGPEESKLGNADLAASGAGLSAARGASVTDPDPSGDRVVAGSGANLAGHIDAAHAQAGASIEMESAKLSTQDRPSTTGAADPIRADEASTASPSARAETRAGAAATPVDVVTGVSMGKLEAAADEVTLPTPSHTADDSGANDARPSQREPASHDGSPASGDAVSVADPGASTDAAREGAGGAPPVDIVTGSTPVKHVAAKADEIATADHPKPADGGDGGDAGRNDGSKDDDLGRHAKHDQDDDDGGHAKHDQDDDDGRHAKHDKDDDDGGTINLDAVHHSHHGHALAVDLDAPPDDGEGHDDGDADGHDATIDDAPDDGGGDAGSDSDDSG